MRRRALDTRGHDGPALWLMPGLMGDCAWAWALAAAWRGPAFALEARGLGEDEALPLDRVEALAAELAGWVDPGPRDLVVGWSFGGLVAWELARRRPGANLAGVALLDCRALVEPRAPQPRLVALEGFVARCAELLGRPAWPREAAAQPPEAREGWFLGRLAQALGDARLARRRWAVYQAHQRAWASYAPKPLTGRALVVEAAHGEPTPDALGWAAHATSGRLTRAVFQADHEGLVRGAHAQALSARLAAWGSEGGA